jgi:hypothetical protein
MKIKLDFYTEYCRNKPIDLQFMLEEERRDLVVHSNNKNLLLLRFYSGQHYHDAIDITGSTFELIVKANPTDDDTSAIFEIEVTDLSNAAEGEAEIPIDLSASGYTDLMGNYIYELRMTTDSGRIKTLCYGTFAILQSLFKN